MGFANHPYEAPIVFPVPNFTLASLQGAFLAPKDVLNKKMKNIVGGSHPGFSGKIPGKENPLKGEPCKRFRPSRKKGEER